MAINTKPDVFYSFYDPESQGNITTNYSYTPGSVGRMGYVGADESLGNPGTIPRLAKAACCEPDACCI